MVPPGIPNSHLDDFRQTVIDPAAWRSHASVLRSAADSLWDLAIENLLSSPKQLKDPLLREEVCRRFADQLHTAQFMYGLAVEAGLKAQVIEMDPTKVEFCEKRDGHGVVVDLRVRRIGVDLSIEGHDLNRLAEVVGVFDGRIGKVCTTNSDQQTLQEILAFLTKCVRWSGRYPAPKSTAEYYNPKHQVPRVALSHYMRDWLDPLLDALLPGSA